MPKRVIAANCVMALVFGLLFTRVAALSGWSALIQAAEVQSTRTVTASAERASIYDWYLRPLVNAESSAEAVIFPLLADGTMLSRLSALSESCGAQISAGTPFTVNNAPNWLS